MTGEQIINFVEVVLIDDRINPDYHLDLINTAIKDISRHAPYIDIESLEFDEDGKAQLPSKFRSMIKLGSLEYKDPSEIDNIKTEGEPSNYYYKGTDTICLYPVPTDTVSYTAVFRRGYDELTSLEESPSIPENFHDMICYYIAWRTHDYFGNNVVTEQKAALFQGEYFRIVGDYKEMIETNFYEYDGMTTKDVLPKSKRWLTGGK